MGVRQNSILQNLFILKRILIFVVAKHKKTDMNSAVYSQKLDLIRWLIELNDSSVLAQIKSIKEDYTALSVAELASIERGLSDFQQGKVRSHSQIKQRYEKWL